MPFVGLDCAIASLSIGTSKTRLFALKRLDHVILSFPNWDTHALTLYYVSYLLLLKLLLLAVFSKSVSFILTIGLVLPRYEFKITLYV